MSVHLPGKIIAPGGLAAIKARAQQAGLRLEDVLRPSWIARQRRLDAKVRQALGPVLRGRRKRRR